MVVNMAIHVKEIMKRRGMGNKELADMTGIPLGTLNKIIYGDTKNPTLNHMHAIAKALNCTLDDFVDSDNGPAPSLSSSEYELINLYRDLNDEGQEKLIEYAHMLKNFGYIKNSESAMVEGA